MTSSRLTRFATLASQIVNVVACNGWPDETVSGHAWRCSWTDDHCRASHALDVAFARLIL